MLETENAIFEAVLQAKLDLQSAPWPSISAPAKDLIKKMLTVDPKKRITAAEALGKFVVVCPNHLHQFLFLFQKNSFQVALSRTDLQILHRASRDIFSIPNWGCVIIPDPSIQYNKSRIHP